MRVTQNMIDRNLQHAINRNLSRLSDLNTQLSTGQKVNKVSDDVPAARQIMSLTRDNSRIDIYLRNLEAVDGVLSIANGALEKASETVSRIKELAIQSATGTFTRENREAMAEGVDGLLRTLVSMANQEHNDAYIFSGESARVVPFEVTTDAAGDISEVEYVGEMVSTEVEIAPGVTVEVNLVGKEVWQGEEDLFETAIALRDAMRANDLDEINNLIDNLEDSHSGIRRALGRMGERQAQLPLLRSATESVKDMNTQIISDRQDTDMAEATMQYKSQLALLQTVLQVAAGSVKPSIMNFL